MEKIILSFSFSEKTWAVKLCGLHYMNVLKPLFSLSILQLFLTILNLIKMDKELQFIILSQIEIIVEFWHNRNKDLVLCNNRC